MTRSWLALVVSVACVVCFVEAQLTESLPDGLRVASTIVDVPLGQALIRSGVFLRDMTQSPPNVKYKHNIVFATDESPPQFFVYFYDSNEYGVATVFQPPNEDGVALSLLVSGVGIPRPQIQSSQVAFFSQRYDQTAGQLQGFGKILIKLPFPSSCLTLDVAAVTIHYDDTSKLTLADAGPITTATAQLIPAPPGDTVEAYTLRGNGKYCRYDMGDHLISPSPAGAYCGNLTNAHDTAPAIVAHEPTQRVYMASYTSPPGVVRVYRVDMSGTGLGKALVGDLNCTASNFSSPRDVRALSIDGAGTYLYAISNVPTPGLVVRVKISDGSCICARVQAPDFTSTHLFVDATFNRAYVLGLASGFGDNYVTVARFSLPMVVNQVFALVQSQNIKGIANNITSAVFDQYAGMVVAVTAHNGANELVRVYVSNCAAYTSCQVCVADPQCVFCGGECVRGTSSGPLVATLACPLSSAFQTTCPAINVTSFWPANGPVDANTTVFVNITKLQGVYGNVYCKFSGTSGDPSLATVIVTNQQYSCVAPPNAQGPSNLTLVTDFQNTYTRVTTAGIAQFFYYNSTVLVELVPEWSDPVTPTSVAVFGNFEASSNVWLIFQSPTIGQTYPCTMINTSFVTCSGITSPSGGVLGGTMTLNVAVSEAAVPFNISVAAPTSYYFGQQASVGGLSISSGPSSGGTSLTVSGTGFQNTQYGACFVYINPSTQTAVPGIYLSATTARCILPSVAAYTGAVTISYTNFQDLPSQLTTGPSFTFYAAPHVSSLSPTSTATPAGGTTITVTGTNFGASGVGTLGCKFGTVTAAASWLSSTQVSCVAPAQKSGGLFAVEVTINGLDYTNDGVTFKYITFASDDCRTQDELSVNKADRLAANQLWFPNLISPAWPGSRPTTVVPTTSAGSNPSYDPPGVIDGDRCCLYTSTNLGYKCGVVFTPNTGIVGVGIGINSAVHGVAYLDAAYVTSIVTTWYNPCLDMPLPAYQIKTGVPGSTTTILTHTTDGSTQAPCPVINSDKGVVAVCTDYFSTPVFGLYFEIGFFNQFTMPSGTHGGWLFEVEIHGIFLDTPWAINVTFDPPPALNAWGAIPIQCNFLQPFPTFGVFTQSIVGVPLIGVDMATPYVDVFVEPDGANAGFAIGETGAPLHKPILANLPVVNGSVARLPLTAGFLAVATLGVATPKVGNYTVTFRYGTLIEASFNITVTPGAATQLALEEFAKNALIGINEFNGPIVRCEKALVLSPLIVSTRDAGGNFSPYPGVFPINGGIDEPAGTSLTKIYSFTNLTNGLLYGNVTFVAPAAGLYTIKFGVPGYFCIYEFLTVITGYPTRLAIIDPPTDPLVDIPIVVYSAASASLPSITIQIADAGLNLIDTLDVKSVYLITASSNGPIVSGATTLNLDVYTGKATFSSLYLVAPRVGTYNLTFQHVDSQLEPVVKTLEIATGVPAALIFANSASLTGLQIICTPVTHIPSVTLMLADAGGNPIPPGKYTSQSVVTMTLLSPSGADVPLNGLRVLNLDATANVNGTISGVTIVNPPPQGVYTVVFTATGMKASFPLTVVAGVASTVQLSKTTIVVDTDTVLRDPNVILDSVDVFAYDIGGNLVGAADSTTRSLSLTAVDPALASLVRWAGGVNLEHGYAHLANITLVTPPTGDFALNVSASGLASTSLVVRITTGYPTQLRFVTLPALTYNNDPAGIKPSPTVEVVDVAGRAVPGVIFVMEVRLKSDLNATVTTILKSVTTSSGTALASFDPLFFAGRRGFSEYLVFSVNQYNLPDLSIAVQISQCLNLVETPDGVGGTACVCQVGTYGTAGGAGTSGCTFCPVNTYQPSALADVQQCIACAVNTHTTGTGAVSIGECVCDTGFYDVSEAGAASTTGRVCTTCPTGALCQGGVAAAAKGFFEFGANSQFYTCPSGACLGNGTCDVGYGGPLCGVCEPGYSHAGGVSCVLCNAKFANWIVTLVVCLAIVLALGYNIWTHVDLTQQKSGLFKSLVNYLQLLSFLAALNIDWPTEMLSFMQAAAVSAVNFSNIAAVGCVLQFSYYETSALIFLLPVAGLAFATAMFLLSMMIVTLLGKKHHYRKMISLWVTSIIVIIFVSHPVMAQKAFEMFNCVDYGNGGVLLVADLSIDCRSPTHLHFQTYGLAVIGYCLFAPVGGFIVLFNYRHRLNEDIVRERLRFLYVDFRHHRFYWEFVVLARKMGIVAILVFMKDVNSSAHTQIYAALWFLTLVVGIHLLLKPYREAEVGRMEIGAVVSCYLTIIGGLTFGELRQQDTQERNLAQYIVVVALILINALMVVVFALYILLAGRKHGIFRLRDRSKQTFPAMSRLLGALGNFLPDLEEMQNQVVYVEKEKESSDDSIKEFKDEPDVGEVTHRSRSDVPLAAVMPIVSRVGFGRMGVEDDSPPTSPRSNFRLGAKITPASVGSVSAPNISIRPSGVPRSTSKPTPPV